MVMQELQNMNIYEFNKTLETGGSPISLSDVDDVANAWELLYKGVVDDYVTERKAKVRTDSLPWFRTELPKLLISVSSY